MFSLFTIIKTLIESLDQLTEWAVDKFKSVRNKNIKPPSFPGHPLTKNELMVCSCITSTYFFTYMLLTLFL